MAVIQGSGTGGGKSAPKKKANPATWNYLSGTRTPGKGQSTSSLVHHPAGASQSPAHAGTALHAGTGFEGLIKEVAADLTQPAKDAWRAAPGLGKQALKEGLADLTNPARGIGPGRPGGGKQALDDLADAAPGLGRQALGDVARPVTDAWKAASGLGRKALSDIANPTMDALTGVSSALKGQSSTPKTKRGSQNRGWKS